MRLLVVCLLCTFLSCCQENAVTKHIALGLKAPLFPDYSDCTVPVNIAPLNFEVLKRCDQVEAVFSVGDREFFRCRGNQYVDIPLKKWRHLLGEAVSRGGEVKVVVSCLNGDKWEDYLPVRYRVSTDSIDGWIAYRLIFPGYEGWGRMGIYERDLSSFEERAILDNAMSGGGCMNCHHFRNYDPTHVVLHLRGAAKGTILVDGEDAGLVTNKLNDRNVPLTYPAWHPGGRYIAFSSNSTFQFFHAMREKQVEVYDERSDIVIYDTEKQCLFTDSVFLARAERFETYPCWSPSGDRLYFSVCDSVLMPEDYLQVRYRICSIGFDAEQGCFSGSLDTVLQVAGKSLVFPRISPDGHYLLVSSLDYGCFPVWHSEADLLVWDLRERKFIVHEANSYESESYHAWSSNGKWVMFGSRRIDGMFTRLWFSYVAEDGRLLKPFLLPQRGRGLRDTRLRSYNVGEFIKGPVKISPRKLSGTAQREES